MYWIFLNIYFGTFYSLIYMLFMCNITCQTQSYKLKHVSKVCISIDLNKRFHMVFLCDCVK